MNEKRSWTEKLSDGITMAGTAILMNLLFIVASIPVVTIGPAWCGLMSAFRYSIRGESWFQGFKKGFCTRFWRSLLCWCLWLPVCLFFLMDLVGTVQNMETLGVSWGTVLDCLIPGVFFTMAGMVMVSMLALNVYIPTIVSDWLRNSINFFRRPLELLAAAALFWAPLLIAVFYFGLITHIIMILLAAYFALAAICGTLVLKEPLIEFLIDARADGTLIAEEGAKYGNLEDE